MIYKLLRAEEWQAFQAAGSFAGSSADLRDGFIHFSTAAQAAETAARHFAGVDPVVLAEVDPARLPQAPAWEPSRGGRLFPHLYAALPLSAVTRSWTLTRAPDGRLALPELPTTRVVFAKEGDVPQILDFIRRLARYEKLEHQVTATEEALRERLFGARRFAEVLLAEEDGKRVGFALFFHNFSTFLAAPGIYLEDLFVVPEARGRGHGKALLASLAKLAVERGCGRLEWAVLDWNEPALRFYKSLGAVPLSDWVVHRVTGERLASLAAASEAEPA